MFCCGGENWWCLNEDALRVVVVGSTGSGKTELIRSSYVNSSSPPPPPEDKKKPPKGNTLAKIEPYVVRRGGMTIHLWEEPAPSRWKLDYKGPEYARVQPDVIIYTFSVVDDFHGVTYEIPNRCRGRTTFGEDLAIPLVIVGTMSDLRYAYSLERKLITDSEARSLGEKMGALYYVEVSAKQGNNVDLLWDILAKSKSMRQWIEAREIRNRRLGLSPPERTDDDEPLLPSKSESRCILS